MYDEKLGICSELLDTSQALFKGLADTTVNNLKIRLNSNTRGTKQFACRVADPVGQLSRGGCRNAVDHWPL